MKNWISLGLISLLGLSGCASKTFTPEQFLQLEDAKLYQIYIDEDGHLLNPASQEIVPIHEEAGYVSNILENFERLNRSREGADLVLTLFIHGGLNTFDAATERVTLFKDKMIKDGRYPLFVSWNSGPLTNYKDHLIRNRRGISSPFLGLISSPFVFLEDSLRAIARIPASTYNVVFGQNTIRKSSDTKEKRAAAASIQELEMLPINLQVGRRGETTAGDWWSVWNPTKLVTAPIIDGLGTGAWSSMLRRADLVLRKDSGFNGEPKSTAHTAVAKFLTAYEQKFGRQGIDLIGHSMGAIIANNIISRNQDLNFNNIVFMGAACRIKDLEYVVVPYLKKNESTKFYNLSIHTYRELSENAFYDFVPRGSLLVWIDQTFGAINSFSDRTAGYWYNIVRAAKNVFKEPSVMRRVYLTEFAMDGDVPKKHGEFDEFNFWQESFWLGSVTERYQLKK